MNMTTRKGKINDYGFAPMIVTIIIVTILSLMTVGFVAIINTSQQNALNLQLNNNAYYAAEVGVNDAVEAINNGYVGPKNNCAPLANNDNQPGATFLRNNVVSGSDVYSCLLINPTPASLQYSSVGAYQPVVAVVAPSVNQTIAKVKISWEPAAQVEQPPYSFASNGWFPNCPGGTGPCFPPQYQWSRNGKPITGILRFSLTPIPHNSSSPQDTSTTYTGFFYPATQGNNVDSYSSSTIGFYAGQAISGACSPSNSTPDQCSVTLLLSSASISRFLMSVRSLYTKSQVTIQIYGINNPNPLPIKNAQVLIDSTGDDHGVLKRIQVRVPGLDYTGFSAFDMASSGKICKDISIFPTNYNTNNPGQVSSSCGI